MYARTDGVYLWRTLQDSDLQRGIGFAACNGTGQTADSRADDRDMEGFIVFRALRDRMSP